MRALDRRPASNSKSNRGPDIVITPHGIAARGQAARYLAFGVGAGVGLAIVALAVSGQGQHTPPA